MNFDCSNAFKTTNGNNNIELLIQEQDETLTLYAILSTPLHIITIRLTDYH